MVLDQCLGFNDFVSMVTPILASKMVKKTTSLRVLSNSDRKIQKLYQQAINEIRDKNTILVEKPVTESQEKTHLAQKKRDKPVYRSREHGPRGRAGRGSLSIPVSKLLPFRYDPRGCHFPVDFRKDDSSKTWVPRMADDSFGSPTSETKDSERSDGYSPCKVRENVSFDDEVFDMDELLQVLPLRAGEDEVTGGSDRSSSAGQSLPPLYKRDVWREIIARASPNSHSIPAKTSASATKKTLSLMIGNEEIYSRERRRKVRKIGLVERRARLRAVAAARSPRHLDK